MAFLRSVRASDIDDQFNPNKMKDKWVKFFRGQISRPQIDMDSALKMAPSDNQTHFLKTESNGFNCYQAIRGLIISGISAKNQDMATRNQLLQKLMSDI